MKPVNVAVLTGFGINSEYEIKYCFGTVGCNSTLVHLSDLLSGVDSLENYQVLFFPGGFSEESQLGRFMPIR